MKYILFVLWITTNGIRPWTSVSAEYNSKEACKAAGDELYIMSKDQYAPTVIFCSAKGEEK